MDSLLCTTKTTLVNLFLSATMTRKIFMWYFIERLLSSRSLNASVDVALREARQQVATTISRSMLDMITRQANDRYGSSGSDSIVTGIATSLLEVTSMGSIVLVMSFVTDEMLAVAHTDRLSTNELLHEVLSGLMVYADTIDKTSDVHLANLATKISRVNSADFFPGITHAIDTDDGSYIETAKFVSAQMAASAHIDNVRERLLKVLRVVNNALTYKPDNAVFKTDHFYPSEWEVEDYLVTPALSTGTIPDFAASRMAELEKLGRLANSVAQTMMLVGVQQMFPNRSGLRFNYSAGGQSTTIDEDTIVEQTKMCIRRAKEIRCFQGTALSLVRALVVHGHRSHINGRARDYPRKVTERQIAADEDARLQNVHTDISKRKTAMAAMVANGKKIRSALKDCDMLFLAWNVAVDDRSLPVYQSTAEDDLFTDPARILTRAQSVFEPYLKDYSRLSGYGNNVAPGQYFLEQVVRPSVDSDLDTMFWGAKDCFDPTQVLGVRGPPDEIDYSDLLRIKNDAIADAKSTLEAAILILPPIADGSQDDGHMFTQRTTTTYKWVPTGIDIDNCDDAQKAAFQTTLMTLGVVRVAGAGAIDEHHDSVLITTTADIWVDAADVQSDYDTAVNAITDTYGTARADRLANLSKYTFSYAVAAAADASATPEYVHPIAAVLNAHIQQLLALGATNDENFIVIKLILEECEYFSHPNNNNRDYSWWIETINKIHEALQYRSGEVEKTGAELPSDKFVPENLRCSQTLHLLLTSTLPTVRTQLLADLDMHVTAATVDEDASGIALLRSTAQCNVSHERLRVANIAVVNADTYQHSQSSDVINGADLQSIGCRFSESVKYDAAEFQKTYAGKPTEQY